ncbi:zinc finger protein DPF3 isoform X7 [Physeter macrocephalus]|uniref:Zinc finger protein DPF3 isoform X7 n=1 Tax=Physeter macrocephalus TaxID=9755 RepID=A0A9W2WZI2_PHYMC|nr:zinc finger protein DPF3 isoform X7 [Physeter catodon]
MATVIHNPLKALGDQFYKEAIEHCRSYNSRLCAERSVRLPFLDSQTGVAQNNCYIWMEKRHRGPGLAPGQLYTYPARCWRKKRRLHPPEDPKLRLLEIKPEVELPLKKDGFTSESTTLEALLRGEGIEKKLDTREEENIQEIQRVLENDENVEEGNEEEDLEEDIPKRKNRTRGRARGSTGGRRKHDATSQEDHDKPYVCDICGKRYKNRPGLSYHYAHTHLASEEGDEAQDQETRSPPNHRNENHRPPEDPFTAANLSCLAWGVLQWILLVVEWRWVLALRWRSLGVLSPTDITRGWKVSGGPMS